MLCNKCGKNIDEGVKFCPFCGEEVKTQLSDNLKNDIEDNKSKKLKSLKIVLSAIISVLVLVFIASKIYIYSIPELENIQDIDDLIADYQAIEDNNTSEYKTDENMIEKLQKYDEFGKVDGLRYAVNGKTAIVIPSKEFMQIADPEREDADEFKFNNNISDIKIPKKLRYNGEIIEVIAIADYAFQNSVDLVQVKIPDTVKKIGKNAFKNCISLQTINIPEGVNKINDFTFMGCLSLKQVVIPDSVIKIGNAAFLGCKLLNNIQLPENIVDIGEFAFSYCTSLTNIKVPDKVQVLKYGVFSDCYSLKTVRYPKNIKGIEEYAFWQCNSLTEINIPDGAEYIGNNAFLGCYSMKKAYIPTSVDKIGESVFQYCESLSEIELPNNLAKEDNYGIWRLNTKAKVNIIT